MLLSEMCDNCRLVASSMSSVRSRKIMLCLGSSISACVNFVLSVYSSNTTSHEEKPGKGDCAFFSILNPALCNPWLVASEAAESWIWRADHGT